MIERMDGLVMDGTTEKVLMENYGLFKIVAIAVSFATSTSANDHAFAS